MADLSFFRGSHNPLNFFKSLRYDLRFYRKNPDYMEPCGNWLFCGCQGSGKTLSATKTFKALAKEYPKAILCSNLVVHGIDRDIIPFTDYEQLFSLSNGINGVIFLIDEIQVVWNSLESKNIPISEIGLFSQMRKDRRIILGTSQVYGRIAKPIREQLRYVVLCNNFLKYIQYNRIIDPNLEGYSGEHDGELDGAMIGSQWFFHSPADYDSYDTLNKIVRPSRGGKK